MFHVCLLVYYEEYIDTRKCLLFANNCIQVQSNFLALSAPNKTIRKKNFKNIRK